MGGGKVGCENPAEPDQCGRRLLLEIADKGQRFPGDGPVGETGERLEVGQDDGDPAASHSGGDQEPKRPKKEISSAASTEAAQPSAADDLLAGALNL